MSDSIRDSKIKRLEQRVEVLEKKLSEMARYLKRAEDDEVQRAGRRGS